MPRNRFVEHGETLQWTGELTPAVKSLPFYKHVPKDVAGNIRYRLSLLRAAEGDRIVQGSIVDMCRLDPLFFLNCFGWLFEPRAEGEEPTVFPLVTWPCQDIVYMGVRDCLGRREVGIKKSRAQGASWLILYLFIHEWIFSKKPRAFGMVSRNEDAVFSDSDPDSLAWKIDHILAHLPTWMVPWYNPDRDKLLKSKTYLNRETGSTIVGSAATKNTFRSGRKTAILWDEATSFPTNFMERALRSTQQVTKCRIILSTPETDQDEFYKLMHEPSSMLWVSMHWSDNPLHGAGLYETDEDGNLTIHDKAYYEKHYPDEPYPFVTKPHIGSRKRSPWYDAECERPGATPQGIAKELDINFGGASYKFFGDLKECFKRATPPTLEGEFDYNEHELLGRFIPMREGKWKLWLDIDQKGRPPISQYAVGCDVAAGGASEFSSNSVCVILDRNSGKQVAEFASNAIFPREFALMVVSVCQWLNMPAGAPTALLNWDVNGLGTQFTRTVLEETDYRFVYRRDPNSVKRMHGKKLTNLPGWNSKDPKILLGDFRTALATGQLTVSDMVLRECSGWEFKNGRPVYVPSLMTQVDSAMGEAHGDRCTSAAIAYQAYLEVGHFSPPPPKRPPDPYGIARAMGEYDEDEVFEDELVFA